MDLPESNLTTCKVCQQLKTRVLVGKYESKNKKYTDELGKLWNGSSCPACHTNNVKEYMKKKRAKTDVPQEN